MGYGVRCVKAKWSMALQLQVKMFIILRPVIRIKFHTCIVDFAVLRSERAPVNVLCPLISYLTSISKGLHHGNAVLLLRSHTSLKFKGQKHPYTHVRPALYHRLLVRHVSDIICRFRFRRDRFRRIVFCTGSGFFADSENVA